LGLSIRIRTIKPGSLPYNRVGDWHWNGETLYISIEDRSDERHEWLIAIHEIIEAYLCKIAGITEESIDTFDKANDGKWVPGGPGYREHLASTGIESILAAITGVNWDKYEEEVQTPPKAEPLALDVQ
jgi:hypothetical protein